MLNMNLLMPVTGRNFIIFLAPKNAKGIHIIEAMNVPITAIAKVSSKPLSKSYHQVYICNLNLDEIVRKR